MENAFASVMRWWWRLAIGGHIPMNAESKKAIHGFNESPAGFADIITLGNHLVLGRSGALNVCSLAILLVSVGCAVGLNVLACAELWPTILPLHPSVTRPISVACILMLFAAGPATQLVGRLSIHDFNLLRGPRRFTCTQAAGWALSGAGLLLVSVDRLATPEVTIAATCLAFGANACLLGSLQMFDAV